MRAKLVWGPDATRDGQELANVHGGGAEAASITERHRRGKRGVLAEESRGIAEGKRVLARRERGEEVRERGGEAPRVRLGRLALGEELR